MVNLLRKLKCWLIGHRYPTWQEAYELGAQLARDLDAYGTEYVEILYEEHKRKLKTCKHCGRVKG